MRAKSRLLSILRRSPEFEFDFWPVRKGRCRWAMPLRSLRRDLTRLWGFVGGSRACPDWLSPPAQLSSCQSRALFAHRGGASVRAFAALARHANILSSCVSSRFGELSACFGESTPFDLRALTCSLVALGCPFLGTCRCQFRALFCAPFRDLRL